MNNFTKKRASDVFEKISRLNAFETRYFILNNPKVCINFRDRETGTSMLHRTISCDYYSTYTLLRLGLDPNVGDKNGFTPFDYLLNIAFNNYVHPYSTTDEWRYFIINTINISGTLLYDFGGHLLRDDSKYQKNVKKSQTNPITRAMIELGCFKFVNHIQAVHGNDFLLKIDKYGNNVLHYLNITNNSISKFSFIRDDIVRGYGIDISTPNDSGLTCLDSSFYRSQYLVDVIKKLRYEAKKTGLKSANTMEDQKEIKNLYLNMDILRSLGCAMCNEARDFIDNDLEYISVINNLKQEKEIMAYDESNTHVS